MDNKNYERAQRFGAYIRALRLASNLTQQELATKCGYTSRAAINRIEKGRNDVALDRLPLISLKSLVGHSASMPTLDIYGHTTDDALRSAQTALNALYNGL